MTSEQSRNAQAWFASHCPDYACVICKSSTLPNIPISLLDTASLVAPGEPADKLVSFVCTRCGHVLVFSAEVMKRQAAPPA